MLCNIRGCTQRTSSIADMGRHIVVHFDDYIPCTGCPKTYARPDSLARHMQKAGDAHTSDARVKFLETFNDLPAVVEMNARQMMGCSKLDHVRFDKDLDKMFTALFAASKAPKA
ncbi:hypothetical protein C8R44DRAFT_774828 [Mycena epipterygia]|nr:hypothetical protein C8R44DRAFT_774828 [Mycena epipterygia]